MTALMAVMSLSDTTTFFSILAVVLNIFSFFEA